MGARLQYWASAVAGVAICLAAFRFAPGKEESSTLTPASNLSRAASTLTAKPAAASPQTPKRLETKGVSAPVPGALLQRFSDPEANVRLRALEKLESLGVCNDQSLAILTAFLSDSDPRIRAYAALRLGSYSMAAIEAVPVLKQLAFTDPNELVRSRAKDALVNIRLYDFSPINVGL